MSLAAWYRQKADQCARLAEDATRVPVSVPISRPKENYGLRWLSRLTRTKYRRFGPEPT